MKRTKAQLIDEIAELKRMLQEAQEIAPQAGHIEVETAEREPGAAGGAQDQAGEGETRETGLGGAAGESTGGALAAAGSETAAVEVGREEEGLFHSSLHPKKEAWLKAFALSGGKIEEAAAAAGVSRWAHHYWMKVDKAFQGLYPQAQAAAVETLRDEVLRRGREGVDEPVFYQGRQIATVKRYSDNLLMFETKRQDPLYRDNPQLALGLKAAGDIKISLSIPRPGEPGEIVDAEAREIPGK